MENVIPFTRMRESFYMYKGQALYINEDDKYKCIPMLVERLADEFYGALKLHCKVLALRIDIHTDTPEMKNTAIENLLRWLKQYLNRYYQMKNIGHMWVREYGDKKKTHWHLVLLLDGNKVQDSWSVVNKIKYYWEEKKQYGQVKPVKSPYVQIIRDDAESFDKAFYRSSYLTKERSKNIGSERSYGSSRLNSKCYDSSIFRTKESQLKE